MNLNNTDYKLTMYKKYIIGLFTLCCAGNAAAQSLAQAKQLFLNGEFEQAKPAFQKLVKQAPSNANYNYWYGACCYETGEKKEAQPYLEKSAARKVIDAYRYLGKLYYDIYRFDDAVDNYEQHIEWLEKKKRPTEMAEAELEQINEDGDFFYQEADQFLIKLDEAALVGLEERLDVLQIGAFDVVINLLLDELFALFA